MKGDFVNKIQVTDDCFKMSNRQKMIDGPKRAAEKKKYKQFFNTRYRDDDGHDRDDCNRII